MNGIEKITGQIDADIQKEIDALIADAKAQAQAIAQRYEAEAQREAEALLERGRADAAEHTERLVSMTRLEAKKRVLAAKQAMVDKAFDAALEQLSSLPEEAYIDLLARLTVSAVSTGREKVILSQKDRSRFGKQIVTKANEILAKGVAPKLPEELTDSKAGALLDKVVAGASALLAGTAMLTLSEQTRPMRGGLILAGDRMEVNCSFETLVRLQKESMTAEVAQVLFGKAE